MLLFSINRSRGYENPSLDIIVIELYSTRGFPLEEAREHCFQIQSVIYVVILISFQCYCGECSSYIVVILPLLAFYFCSAYILYLVYYMVYMWIQTISKSSVTGQPQSNSLRFRASWALPISTIGFCWDSPILHGPSAK
jgi:hypothetical protein